MSIGVRAGIAAVLAAALAAPAMGAGSARLIVHYEPGAMRLGATLGYAEVVAQRRGREVLRVPESSVAAVRRDLRRRAGVRVVERDARRTRPPRMPQERGADGVVRARNTLGPPAVDDSGNPLFNDPYFPAQDYWADPADQPQRAGASDFAGAVSATRVVEPPRVAVLDSGVAGYQGGPDWAGGVNLVSEEANGRGSLAPSEWRILPQYREWCDTNTARHGSQIGAVIAAPRDNGTGIAGVVPGADLYAGRVLNCEGSGRVSDVVDAIDWAAGVDSGRPGVTPLSEPVDVISLSLGAEGACSFSEQEAIDRARDRGVLVVASAGNDPAREPEDSAPANCDGVLAVTAVDAAGDHVVGGVSVGAGADLAAQGFEVAVEDDRGIQWLASGTSFSAPMVSATAALALANVPSLPVSELEQALRGTARPPQLSAEAQAQGVTQSDFGAGIVDALATLEALAGARTDPRGAALGPPLQGVRSQALRTAAGAALAAGGLVSDPQRLRELSVSEAFPRSEMVLFSVAADQPLQLSRATEVAASPNQRVMVGVLESGRDYALQFCDGAVGERVCESEALVPLSGE
ncbi:S8 family peptidase [Vreelandella utahensis]|uniref:S8 family peptidase n=1 Tax=Vreelandella halophila TaxID=86177 RepID=UPI00117ABB50|nr:S8 family serine peptidase [Halomonas utahensis]